MSPTKKCSSSRPPYTGCQRDSKAKGNEADGKDLTGRSSHGKGPADVEGLRCCPTCHQGVMGNGTSE